MLKVVASYSATSFFFQRILSSFSLREIFLSPESNCNIGKSSLSYCITKQKIQFAFILREREAPRDEMALKDWVRKNRKNHRLVLQKFFSFSPFFSSFFPFVCQTTQWVKMKNSHQKHISSNQLFTNFFLVKPLFSRNFFQKCTVLPDFSKHEDKGFSWSKGMSC